MRSLAGTVANMDTGLQMLDGTEVIPDWISLTPDDKGNNFNATTLIPNRSRVSFELVSQPDRSFSPAS